MNTPMQKIFRRGQIWHWKDPEYLEKSKGSKIPDTDAAYRYSRYVVIVQDPKSCSRKSILVVPCSSSNNMIHDVGMEIDHLHFSKRCYAKCQSIFPADPRCLDCYIGNIDEATMAVIEGELVKMLFPTIIGTTTPNDLKELFGINTINMTTTGKQQGPFSELHHDLSLFFKRHVHYTHNMDNRLTLQEIFTAYEKFCIRNGYAVEDNMAYFADGVIHIMNVKLAAKQRSCRWARESTIKNMAFRGVVLVNTDELEYIDMVFDVDDPTEVFAESEDIAVVNGVSTFPEGWGPSDEPEESEKPEEPDAPDEADHEDNEPQGDDKRVLDIPTEIIELTEEQRHVPGEPWTDAMKRAYISIAEKFGPDATAAFYGINAASAKRYISNFKRELNVEGRRERSWPKDKKMKFIAYYEKHGPEKAAKAYGLTTHSATCRASHIREEFNLPKKSLYTWRNSKRNSK